MRDYLIVGFALMITLFGAYFTAGAIEQPLPTIKRAPRGPASVSAPAHHHHAVDMERAFAHKNFGSVR
jgi:hypothetical protein